MKIYGSSLKKYNVVNSMTITILVVLFSLQMIFTTFLRANIIIDGILDALMQGALLIAEMLVFVKSIIKIQELSKLNITDKANKMLQIVVPLLIVLIMTIVNSVRGGEREEDSILILCVMAALCVDYNYRIILKTAYRCGVIIVLVTFILSMLGLIENNRGNSFGFIYRTDYACHLLFLFLIFCFYYSGYLSWQGELGIFAMTLINIVFIKGKTSYICMAIVVFVTYLSHYRRINRIPFQEENKIIRMIFKIIYLPIVAADKMIKLIGNTSVTRIRSIVRVINKYSFIIWAIVMIGLTMMYAYVPVKLFDFIPKSGSVRARLRLGILGFEQFPIKLFGNRIPQRGAGGTEGYIPFYYFLDSSYIRMILQSGLIVFTVIVGLMTYIQIRLYKEKMYYNMFILAIVALDCAMEHHIVDFSYNTFALLTWATLASRDLENIEPILLNIKNTRLIISKPFRLAYIIVVGFICLAIGCSLFASYEISTFRAHEPTSTSTVILTGNSLDGFKSEKLLDRKIDSVKNFLKFKENSACILSGTEDEISYMREQLVNSKINDSRLYEVESSSIENTIKDSIILIKENNLPKRKAFCSFKPQQKRIWELAHRNGIPINVLNAKMPAEMYVPFYLVEQIKLIKVIIENHA